MHKQNAKLPIFAYQDVFLIKSVFLYKSIQVVTNEKGKKTAVLVPIADWEEIQKRLNTDRLFDEFTSSMKAVQEDINGNTKLKNASDLINIANGDVPAQRNKILRLKSIR